MRFEHKLLSFEFDTGSKLDKNSRIFTRFEFNRVQGLWDIKEPKTEKKVTEVRKVH